MERVRIKRKGGIKSGKGPRFERAICQRLSLWVSRMRREDVFWRSAMSGGRATLRSRKVRGSTPIRAGKNATRFDAHCGDVTATHAVGSLLTELFVVECKHYRELKADQLFYGRTGGKIQSFWKKVRQEARESNRQPLLIMRENNRPDVLCTTTLGVATLHLGDVLANAHFPRLKMWVYLLADVLEGSDFDLVRKQHQHPKVIASLFRE